MTAFPVCEQIAQCLANRVAQVTAANGYQTTVAGVVRPKALGGYTPIDLLAVLVQGDPVRDPANTMPAEAIVWRQPFYTALFVKPSNRDATPADQFTNLFMADVFEAICTDLSGHFAWYRFADAGSPLAIEANIGDPTSIITKDGALEGIILPTSVLYAHPLADPYTVFETE